MQDSKRNFNSNICILFTNLLTVNFLFKIKKHKFLTIDQSQTFPIENVEPLFIFQGKRNNTTRGNKQLTIKIVGVQRSERRKLI